MGYHVEIRVGLFRIIDTATGKAAKTGNAKAVDQGGFRSEIEAHRVRRAFIASQAAKKKRA